MQYKLLTQVITIRVVVPYSIRGDDLSTRYTPAVTSVAAWIRALTGVGPSIASGSHVCSPNWALLPIAANRSSRPIIVIESSLILDDRLNTVL